MSDSPNKFTRWLTNAFLFVVAIAVLAATTVTLQRAGQQMESQDRFQQCLTAILFLPIEDRKNLTDEKIETACNIDAAKVREIRNRLAK